MKIIYKNILKLISGFFCLFVLTNCSADDDCGYIEVDNEYSVIESCPGFIQNGGFEILEPNANPNAVVDNDINLASGWGALWKSGSLADLFDDATTHFNGLSAPIPQNTGVFSGMWVANYPNPSTAGTTYREGMFNQLNTVILPNTGVYTVSFNYAFMGGGRSTPVKIGVYGVHYTSGVLPANPTSMGTPSNVDLFGEGEGVLLGEVIVPTTVTSNWTFTSFTFDTSTLSFPFSNSITHIMITNSHEVLPNFGSMYMSFDDFCLTN